MLGDGRRCPGVAFVAVLLPERFTRPGIEAFDGGLPRVVPDENELSAMHHGRATFSKAGSNFRWTKITLPEFLPFERISEESRRTEPAIEAFPVAER